MNRRRFLKLLFFLKPSVPESIEEIYYPALTEFFERSTALYDTWISQLPKNPKPGKGYYYSISQKT